MKRRIAAIILASSVAACSSPPSKSNSATNGATNNGPNNANSVNSGNNGSTSGPTVLEPDDYDQTCMFDGDCQLVWGGDVCGCGAICPDALSADGAAAMEEDREEIVCDDDEPIACPGAACEPMIAVCQSSGECEAISEVEITTDGYDTSCDVDSDCVLVESGRICTACDCPNAAINVSAEAEYESNWSSVDCNPGPSACDCLPIEAWCNAGTCDTRDS